MNADRLSPIAATRPSRTARIRMSRSFCSSTARRRRRRRFWARRSRCADGRWVPLSAAGRFWWLPLPLMAT